MTRNNLRSISVLLLGVKFQERSGLNMDALKSY